MKGRAREEKGGRAGSCALPETGSLAAPLNNYVTVTTIGVRIEPGRLRRLQPPEYRLNSFSGNP